MWNQVGSECMRWTLAKWQAENNSFYGHTCNPLAVLLIRTYAFFNRSLAVLVFLICALGGVVAYQLYVDTSQMEGESPSFQVTKMLRNCLLVLRFIKPTAVGVYDHPLRNHLTISRVHVSRCLSHTLHISLVCEACHNNYRILQLIAFSGFFVGLCFAHRMPC